MNFQAKKSRFFQNNTSRSTIGRQDIGSSFATDIDFFGFGNEKPKQMKINTGCQYYNYDQDIESSPYKTNIEAE